METVKEITTKNNIMTIESNFEGSPLQTELRNATGLKFEKFKTLTIQALENNQQSKFWNDAVNFINNKNK
jgi:hypothetical protein